jgi:hypothetical protein
MFEQARHFQFDGIFVENVLNPTLCEVLLRYGYTEVESSGFGQNFWKAVSRA